jgi:transcriptional repressor of cell division inhibition gene dicB
MLKSEAVAHFGTQVAVAKAVGISKQGVGNWRRFVPEGHAYKLQTTTEGALQVKPVHYVRLRLERLKMKQARQSRAARRKAK